MTNQTRGAARFGQALAAGLSSLVAGAALASEWTQPPTDSASSPSIYWNDSAILAEERKFLAGAGALPGVRLLITVGEFEQKSDPANEERMRRLYAASPEYLRGRTTEQAIEESRQGARNSRMVDNARELAQRIRAHGADVRFFEFAGKSHHSVVPPAIGRTLPLAVGSPQ